MGRPVNPRFLGDPDQAGFQITGTVLVDVGEGVEGGVILRQRSNNRYLVEGKESETKRVCKLVDGVPQAVGEMSVSVFNGLAALQESQVETDFDGVGENGTFTAGIGYSVGDDITLSNGAVVSVAVISADRKLIAGQDETNFDGVGDNGTFTAGTGYTAEDEITLSNGDVVTVNTVDGGGEILTFSVTESNGVSQAGVQLTTTGGTGNDDFTLTPGTDNLEDFGDVTEFSITNVGDSFEAGSTLTQDSVDPVGGEGFELTPSVDNVDRAPIGFARNINNRTVKTFDGDVLSWPKGTEVTRRTKVDVQGR